MLLCVPFSIYYGASDLAPLLISGCITGFFGLLLLFFVKKSTNLNIGKREGYIVVSFSWIFISLFGALPFVISGSIPNYTNAFFESMSGFTTTGATILVDIEAMPKGVLFWRSMTHLIGGMGIIVLSMAVLPFLGIGGMQVFTAEMSGLKADKLHPRITETAKRLWFIYFGLVIILTVLLLIGGLDLFDSLCHAFSTIATGGFSPKNDSIAGMSSFIQYVIIVFMVIAGINFTLHYLFLHRSFSKVFKNEELRFYLLLLAGAGILVGSLLIFYQGLPVESAFRHGLFQVVSIVTTTGFITTDYLAWSPFIWFILFFLMFTSGCAGSTSGGMKAIRTLLLIKSSSVELKRLVHPRAMIPVRFNKKTISTDVISKMLAFFFFYIAIFFVGALILSFLGLDFKTAMGSSISAIGNIGPAIGGVGPAENFFDVPVAGKWLLSLLMLIGRLELFTVLVLLSPAFWRD